MLRPAWLTDEDEVNYEITEKGAESFKAPKCRAGASPTLIVKAIASPALHSHANIGVDKPNTEGDKPAFH